MIADQARARFREIFDYDAAGVAFAPGRVNLVGEHTDYNDGFVLPMAIDRGIALAFAPRHRRRVARALSGDASDARAAARRACAHRVSVEPDRHGQRERLVRLRRRRRLGDARRGHDASWRGHRADQRPADRRGTVVVGGARDRHRARADGGRRISTGIRRRRRCSHSGPNASSRASRLRNHGSARGRLRPREITRCSSTVARSTRVTSACQTASRS